MRKNILVIFSLFVSTSVFAYHPSQWVRHEVPGAVCGNGKPFSIFIREGNKQNILVEFMGGGACWSKETCSLQGIRGWIHGVAFKTPEVVFDQDKFKDDLGIFIPYCTADVHMGDLVMEYDDLKVHYQGKKNVELAIEYLTRNKIISWNQVQRFGVWGSSAGAIGALVHAHRFEELLPDSAKRFLIADSPGLHFGNQFWQKFPLPLYRAIQKTSKEAGLLIRHNQGLLAPAMGRVFDRLANWDIRLLFATRDWAMSDVYGDIPADEYRELLLSTQGLPHVAASYHNVRTFLLESRGHALLIFPQLAEKKGFNGETAYEFINKP